jgi:dolichyl-phosphate beta-glucosyltransferase
MSGKIRLSIIIPAYNEDTRLTETLTAIDSFLNRTSLPGEIIIIDDASQDATSQVVKDFIGLKKNIHLIRNEINVGKGASVKQGMAMAQGDYCLFTDADNSTPIEEVEKFLAVMNSPDGTGNGIDVAIASRRISGALLAKRQPFYRELSGRIFSLMVRLLAFQGFLDTQCGFKMFTRDAATKIFPLQTLRRFGFDVEVLYVAIRRFHLRVKEIPVTWTDSPNTKVRLFRDSVAMFFDLITIRWNDIRNKYK